MMKKTFDTYLFADWSAANRPTREKPKADAIWIGELEHGTAEPETHYLRTRYEATCFIQDRLKYHLEQERRVLAGFDFPYGFPCGTGAALGVDQKSPWLGLWRLLARLIEDSPRNANNRWEVAARLNQQVFSDSAGPFWGCPKSRQSKSLTSCRIGHVNFPYVLPDGRKLCRKRLPEECLRGTQEVWRLYGAGSVGSQALVGIPCVHRLRFAKELEAHSLVWPFETGFGIEAFRDRRPLIVHAEIWPGVVDPAVRVDPSGEFRDQIQVKQLCLWASREDAAGRLQQLLERPQDISDAQGTDCVQEEGWILGALNGG